MLPPLTGREARHASIRLYSIPSQTHPTSAVRAMRGPNDAHAHRTRCRARHRSAQFRMRRMRPRRDNSGQVLVAVSMPKSPTCANCGRPMVETPRSLRQDGKWDLSVFECSACRLDFFTEDHVPFTGAVMSEPRKRIDPVHCLAKEAECRQLSTDGQLTPERRTSFLNMAETWAGLARESEPQGSDK